MLVINYNGNKPITDYFKFSVQGNNNADKIRFLVSLNQSGLVFDNTYHIYAKVQCVDDDFYDKVELSEINFDDSNNLLDVYFSLEAKHTFHKQIEVSLSCEDLNNEIVWQTALVKIAIMGGVNADEGVANLYPSILQQLQKQIDELKQQGGGVSEVKIKGVYLSYDEEERELFGEDDWSQVGKRLEINYIYDSDFNSFNHPDLIYLNIVSTPIDEATKKEIQDGNFVLRFDYPIRHHKNSVSKPSGMGVKSFTRNFDILHSPNKRSILVNSLIFVREDNIRTNNRGEEYIHIQMTYTEFVAKMWGFKGKNGRETKDLRLKAIDDDGLEYITMLDQKVFGGIPMRLGEQDSGYNFFSTMKPYNFNNGDSYGFTSNMVGIGGQTNIGQYKHICKTKLDPRYSIYAPVWLNNNYELLDEIDICSPYCLYRKDIKLNEQNNRYIISDEYRDEGRLISKLDVHSYTSCSPRFAVLKEDYMSITNKGTMWKKKHPQSNICIKTTIREIGVAEEAYFPIVRTFITHQR